MASSGFIKVGNKTENMNYVGEKLFSDFDFSDVTLVCADNHHLPAHRAILCASSSFLRELLYDSQQQRTFLYFGRVEQEDMMTLLEFIYLGACSVQRSRLEEVVRLAAELEVSKFTEDTKIYKDISNNDTNGIIGSSIPPDVELQKNQINSVKIEILNEDNKNTINYKQTALIPFINQTPGKQTKSEAIETVHEFEGKNTKKLVLYNNLTDLQDNDPLESVSRNIQGQESNLKIESSEQAYLGVVSVFDYTNKTIKIKKPSQLTKKGRRVHFPKTKIPEVDAEGKYNCEKCAYRTENKHRYVKHKVLRHEGFSYNCEKCPSSFKSPEGLKTHIESFHKGVWFKCAECKKQFSLKISLERHEGGKKGCTVCDYSSCAKKVDRHMSTIHNMYFSDGFFRCDVCSFQATKCARLLHHKSRTHTSILVSCDYCDYKNKSKSLVKFHTEEKHYGVTYPCGICDFRTTKKKLLNHRVKEHNIKDLSCKDCSYVGKSSSGLQYHIGAKHPNEDYICTKCNMKFHSRNSLMRHKKHQHENQPIICDQCSYAGKSIPLLELHIKSRHTDLFHKQCSKCSYKATNKINLHNHEQVVHAGIKFECEKCGKQSKTPRGLVNHKRMCVNGQRLSEKKDKFIKTEEKLGESQEQNSESNEKYSENQENFGQEIAVALEGKRCESKDCCRIPDV